MLQGKSTFFASNFRFKLWDAHTKLRDVDTKLWDGHFKL